MRETAPPLKEGGSYETMLAVAVEEARLGLAEGGVPIGAALFEARGVELGRGRNQRVQDGDPTMHAEVVAFRNSSPRDRYDDTVLATTLAPCWLCSGLIRQFGIGTVVVGDSSSYGREAMTWLEAAGVNVIELHSPACLELFRQYVDAGGEIWTPGLRPEVDR